MAAGLEQVLGGGAKHQGIVSAHCLTLIKNLNKLRRGVADLELDSDNVIVAIKEFISHKDQTIGVNDVFAVAYNILYLVANEEYSVREYAEHAFSFLLEKLKGFPVAEQEKLVQLVENQFVGDFLHTVKDELALKTVLICLRHLVVFANEQGIQTRHMVKNLMPLCSPKDETIDFFANCLSIKLKERQRSLKILKTHLDNGAFADKIKTIQHVIMPIVDYLVFGGSTQAKNRRDTISYDKNQKILTLDEGLAVYTAFARQLGWSEYYKLLKKLLFKLQLASAHSRSVSAQGEPELQKEKIITKAICKILDGFHFDEVQDVVEVIANQHEERMKRREASGEAKLWNSDFSDLLRT